jgi:hypothetical protein
LIDYLKKIIDAEREYFSVHPDTQPMTEAQERLAGFILARGIGPGVREIVFAILDRSPLVDKWKAMANYTQKD